MRLDSFPTVYAARSNQFKALRRTVIEDLLEQEPIHPTHWQKLDVSSSPAHATYELEQVTLHFEMPHTESEAVESIAPDLPWAEGHFQERVAGRSVNPGDWHDKWPYHQGQVQLHQNGGRYDHNYMERIWPAALRNEVAGGDFTGYRFHVGDLNDVVRMMVKEPSTRQAYLPIWFPEDTGATSDQRVPCSIGYHFLLRGNNLNLTYTLRSCEAYRHFTNDVYMAVRLAQWVAGKLSWEFGRVISAGNLHMTIASFHGFVGDTNQLEALCG